MFGPSHHGAPGNMASSGAGLRDGSGSPNNRSISNLSDATFLLSFSPEVVNHYVLETLKVLRTLVGKLVAHTIFLLHKESVHSNEIEASIIIECTFS